MTPRPALKQSNQETEEIALINVKTGKIQKLTENNFKDTNPYYSPDGKKIVLVSAKTGNLKVYLVDFKK